MAVRSKTSWPVMALVMRSMSSGLISRYGKTDMENLLLGLKETQSADCAKRSPNQKIGASESPCDRYGRAQFNMTCFCRFFSYPSHHATDFASCERLYRLVMLGSLFDTAVLPSGAYHEDAARVFARQRSSTTTEGFAQHGEVLGGLGQAA